MNSQDGLQDNWLQMSARFRIKSFVFVQEPIKFYSHKSENINIWPWFLRFPNYVIFSSLNCIICVQPKRYNVRSKYYVICFIAQNTNRDSKWCDVLLRVFDSLCILCKNARRKCLARMTSLGNRYMYHSCPFLDLQRLNLHESLRASLVLYTKKWSHL